MKNEQAKTRRARVVRFGNIDAAIWRNEGEDGPWYNVTFERMYREGEDYKYSSSFGRDDLLPLAKAADVAHTEVCNLERFGEDD